MNFLKMLTALTFQVTGYGQGIVHFKCSKTLKPDTAVDGVAVLPGNRRFDLSVKILTAGGGAYTAHVTGPPESIKQLEQVYLPKASGEKEQMFYKPVESAMTRHARTYAVRSRSFPNFKGTTAELSREGMFVMLTGTVEAGTELSVQIDLDDTGIPPISADATVDWCTQRDMKTWIASLTFKPLSEAADSSLKEFLNDLKDRAPGSASVLKPQ